MSNCKSNKSKVRGHVNDNYEELKKILVELYGIRT